MWKLYEIFKILNSKRIVSAETVCGNTVYRFSDSNRIELIAANESLQRQWKCQFWYDNFWIKFDIYKS
jgi:hypothetical protein